MDRACVRAATPPAAPAAPTGAASAVQRTRKRVVRATAAPLAGGRAWGSAPAGAVNGERTASPGAPPAVSLRTESLPGSPPARGQRRAKDQGGCRDREPGAEGWRVPGAAERIRDHGCPLPPDERAPRRGRRWTRRRDCAETPRCAPRM